jgi:hypothetical protein
MPTYLVESYGTGSSMPDQWNRAELAAELSEGVQHIRTTFVPGDETLLHVFEATSADSLVGAAVVAGLEYDRIVEIVEAWTLRSDGDRHDDGTGG